MTKIALITGASRGLGKALALTLGDAGYKLILHSKDKELSDLANADYVHIKGDLRNNNTILKLAVEAKKQKIDILINNAGIYRNESFEHTSDNAIRDVIETNLIAPMLLTKAIWPVFKEKRSGLIININSIAGKQGSNGEAIYCASKHGLRGWTSSLQFDAVKDGIRVIDVFLGGMNTDMTATRPNKEKLIDTQDAAKTILTLCKEYASLRITEIDINRRIY